LGDPGVDRGLNKRWIFTKWNVVAWNGLIWHRIRTGAGHL